MKRRYLVWLLGAEALLCVLFSFFQTSFSGFFTAALAFPFEQIGLGLRSLSLSHGIGNAAALVIYFALCLLPVAALVILRSRRKLYIEDGLLGLFSAVLFLVLYVMINPGMIVTVTRGAAGLSVGKAILGGMVYSVLIGYFVLRALRLFSCGGTIKLVRYMSVMLTLLSMLFVYLVFGALFGDLLGSIAALRAGNVGNEHLLGVTYVFLVLQFIVEALPYFLSVLIVFAAKRLLGEMQADRYSAETIAASELVSRLCAATLAVTILAGIGYNLLQLLFSGSLVVISGSVQIPVFSIIFVLASLLLTRLIAENKQLKDDNDLFV